MRQKKFISRKPNKYRFENECVVIECNQGYEVMIDKEDFALVSTGVCAVRKGAVQFSNEHGTTSLAKVLIGEPAQTRRVLHKNRDSLDNRRENLFCGNVYTRVDDYYVAECYDGSTFKISAEDYDEVSKYVWHIDKNGYVITKVNGRVIKLHRLICGIVDNPKFEVDHLYHDLTDNRREKIKIVNRSENCLNRRKGKGNTSGSVGVYWSRPAQKWCAQIGVKNTRKYLGSFERFEDAVAARKHAEQQYGCVINA